MTNNQAAAGRWQDLPQEGLSLIVNHVVRPDYRQISPNLFPHARPATFDLSLLSVDHASRQTMLDSLSRNFLFIEVCLYACKHVTEQRSQPPTGFAIHFGEPNDHEILRLTQQSSARVATITVSLYNRQHCVCQGPKRVVFMEATELNMMTLSAALDNFLRKEHYYAASTNNLQGSHHLLDVNVTVENIRTQNVSRTAVRVLQTMAKLVQDMYGAIGREVTSQECQTAVNNLPNQQLPINATPAHKIKFRSSRFFSELQHVLEAGVPIGHTTLLPVAFISANMADFQAISLVQLSGEVFIKLNNIRQTLTSAVLKGLIDLKVNGTPVVKKQIDDLMASQCWEKNVIMDVFTAAQNTTSVLRRLETRQIKPVTNGQKAYVLQQLAVIEATVQLELAWDVDWTTADSSRTSMEREIAMAKRLRRYADLFTYHMNSPKGYAGFDVDKQAAWVSKVLTMANERQGSDFLAPDEFDIFVHAENAVVELNLSTYRLPLVDDSDWATILSLFKQMSDDGP